MEGRRSKVRNEEEGEGRRRKRMDGGGRGRKEEEGEVRRRKGEVKERVKFHSPLFFISLRDYFFYQLLYTVNPVSLLRVFHSDSCRIRTGETGGEPLSTCQQLRVQICLENNISKNLPILPMKDVISNMQE